MMDIARRSRGPTVAVVVDRHELLKRDPHLQSHARDNHDPTRVLARWSNHAVNYTVKLSRFRYRHELLKCDPHLHDCATM